MIAFGGGIVGDVGGFVASIFMRGIPYVQVPTTFLAQVDSSVGGKVGVNLPEGKNLVGSFHHPRAVFADIGVLGTLSDRELRAGLMESVKAGIIRDRALVRYMEENADDVLGRDPKALERVIAASIRMKAGVVNKDERESGLRMILNFGHTVGHALEQATGYKAMLHGEAVAWGMVAALSVARQRGTISAAQMERLERLVYRYGPLPRAQAARTQGRCGYRRRQEERRRRAPVRAAARHRQRRRGGRCNPGRNQDRRRIHAGSRTSGEVTSQPAAASFPFFRPLNADADFVPRPERPHGFVVHHRFAVALHFNHGCGLIGRLHRQPRQTQCEFVLRELDLLAGLEQPRRKSFGLDSAERNHHFRLIEAQPLGCRRVPGPEMLVNI